ncbi:hypothetical protein DY000_02052458 [Brassica cretica]|uniref:RRM domain-containing protein n=1 Tax=Brassica cretica TaxID=69181 RepID=A0ABQ7AC26_BRACR|nr:hypothetical protein DY000_02052458 [Brassica cretica]
MNTRSNLSSKWNSNNPTHSVLRRTDQKSDKASSSFWIVFRNFPAEFRSGYGEMKWGSWVFIDIFSE